MKNYFQQISIALIDDNELFREGIKRILEGSNLFEIVWEGKNAILIDQLNTAPDIILMDLTLYEKSDAGNIKYILDKFTNTKLALFSAELNGHQVLNTIEIGIKGYLTKEMEVNSLITALQAINDGKYWIHPDITHHLVSEYMQTVDTTGTRSTIGKRAIQRPVNLLSDREYEVLQLLAYGYNNQRISEKLGVTQSTVKNHVTSIFIKLKVKDRTQAVIKAIQNSWVEIDGAVFDPIS